MRSTENSIQPSVDPIGSDSDRPTDIPDHLTQVLDQDVADAKRLIINLAGAIKSYSIYPKNHDIPRMYLRRLSRGLESFFSSYGVFRFDADKGKLFFKDHQIYGDDEQESNIAYLLSRDGMKWVEFHPGIQQNEIEVFIELINEYRIITPISDGDIVTAFWERNFRHIKHEAVDLILKNGPPLDLTKFKAVDLENLETGETKKQGKSDRGNNDGHSGSNKSAARAKSFHLMEVGKELWGLSEEEKQYLKKLVADEEKKDHTNSVSEILMLSLLMQSNEQDFIKALHFLQDRLVNTFQMGQFKISYTILYNINKVKGILTPKRNWTTPLLQDFIASVSQSKCFSTLPRFLNEETEEDPGSHLKYLWPALRLLNTDILESLGPLVIEVNIDQNRRQLFKLIAYQAERDSTFFKKTLLAFDEKLILAFIPIIGMLNRSVFIALMLQLTKHQSDVIRNKASRKLLLREPAMVNQLLFLLDDPLETIRRRVLMYMGRQRESKVEKYLLRYFHGTSIKQHDPEHLLRCYEALGLCGSTEAIPFLKRILFEKKIRNFFVKTANVHKKGAAISLLALGLPEARRLLFKGRRSIFPSIRLNCKLVLDHQHESS